MTESLLRIAYLAIGAYTFASALLTQVILSRGGQKSPVELFSMGTLWVSFIAFVLIVSWATKIAGARPGHKVAEAFLRVSFLTIGLLFFTCALASTMTFTSASSGSSEWVGIAGLWLSFAVFCALIGFSNHGKSAGEGSVGSSALA